MTSVWMGDNDLAKQQIPVDLGRSAAFFRQYASPRDTSLATTSVTGRLALSQ